MKITLKIITFLFILSAINLFAEEAIVVSTETVTAPTVTESTKTATVEVTPLPVPVINQETAKQAEVVIKKNAPELGKETPATDTEKLQTALLVMARRGDIKAIKNLVKTQNLNLNQPGEYGMTPLLAATKTGQEKTVKFLIKNGADVQDRSINGIDGLRFAVEAENSQLVKIFVKSGVKSDNQDYIGDTSVMVAMKKNNKKILEIIMSNLKDIRLNLQNRDGESLLMLAVKNNDLNLVKKLIKAEANIWLLDKDGHDALSYAEKNNNKKITELLKKAVETARKNDPKVEQWVRKSGSAN